MLLKNGKNIDEPLLPLPKRASKILVAGSHAHNIGNQCGGFTIEWRGLPGNITIGISSNLFKLQPFVVNIPIEFDFRMHLNLVSLTEN